MNMQQNCYYDADSVGAHLCRPYVRNGQTGRNDQTGRNVQTGRNDQTSQNWRTSQTVWSRRTLTNLLVQRIKSIARRFRIAMVVMLCLLSVNAFAGNQQYEKLAASVRSALNKAISDNPPTVSSFKSNEEAVKWLAQMSPRLARRVKDPEARIELLKSIHYEASRAGLSPEMVLGLIQVESNFRKYALSSVGARGYMQVMPFWVGLIGNPDDNLFQLRTNLRYGCTILRHYLDIEKGDTFRALGRYNGSLGKAEYPNLVRAAWQNWTVYDIDQLTSR